MMIDLWLIEIVYDHLIPHGYLHDGTAALSPLSLEPQWRNDNVTGPARGGVGQSESARLTSFIAGWVRVPLSVDGLYGYTPSY